TLSRQVSCAAPVVHIPRRGPGRVLGSEHCRKCCQDRPGSDIAGTKVDLLNTLRLKTLDRTSQTVELFDVGECSHLSPVHLPLLAQQGLLVLAAAISVACELIEDVVVGREAGTGHDRHKQLVTAAVSHDEESLLVA